MILNFGFPKAPVCLILRYMHQEDERLLRKMIANHPELSPECPHGDATKRQPQTNEYTHAHAHTCLWTHIHTYTPHILKGKTQANSFVYSNNPFVEVQTIYIYRYRYIVAPVLGCRRAIHYAAKDFQPIKI